MSNDDEKASNAELEQNALLKAIRPGGILHSYFEKGPLEVLCCPQQSFLEESGLVSFLLLPSLTTEHLSSSSSSVNTIPIMITLDKSTFNLTPKQHDQISRVLREQFLDYHMIHFDGVASPAFVTVRGQRGEFAGDLKSVARYGRIGASNVICDFDPIINRDDPVVPDYHPCKLHIFIIEEPLMDRQEMQNTIVALKRCVQALGESKLSKKSEKELNHNNNVQNTNASLDVNSTMEGRFSRDVIANYRRSVVEDNDIRFVEFQRSMELPICSPLVKTLSNFVETIQQRDLPLLDNMDVKRATTFCMDQCRRIPLFANDNTKLQILAEGFEKYIMTKLYWRAFGVDPAEKKINLELNDKLFKLSSLINPKDIDALEGVEEHNLWAPAMFELEGMNFFKSPRDKIRCIVRACRKISEIISSVLAPQKEKTKLIENNNNIFSFGADELLPCFMLLVLRAIPYNYYLNLQYVKKFREVDLMSPEEAYCLANLESAAEFWLTYNGSSLLLSLSPNKNPITTTISSTTPSSINNVILNSTDELIPEVTTDMINNNHNILPLCSSSSSEDEEEEEKDLEKEKIKESKSISSNNNNNNISSSSIFLLQNETKTQNIDVAKLLLEDNKSFEELTVAELRAIVNEARSLLTEKIISNSTMMEKSK